VLVDGEHHQSSVARLHSHQILVVGRDTHIVQGHKVMKTRSNDVSDVVHYEA